MRFITDNFVLLSALIFLSIIGCQEATSPPPYPLRIIEVDMQRANANADRIRQGVGVEIAEGLELSLWAADRLVTDPVAISTDPSGGIYYTRGGRLQNSEFDIRGHRDWMTQSISFQSVEDRRSFLRATFAPEKSEANKKQIEDLNGDGSHDWKDLTVEKESVWRLEDRNNDGVADRAQLYIEDFHEEITDLANGVEYYDGQVFISVGPNLWRTLDTNNDGIADHKESLAHGFGVHIGFGAHGMSGVTMGPDGRIYWGIGDIGMNVVDKSGKRWKYPNQGVIVRCEPDGSNFEVFAAGLRNTHEFVFDQYGNLISEDNDGDHAGERERLVYITNGSDGGWRINWQFGKYTDPDNNSYKVWMDEQMHIPRWEGQAAYFTPPITNYINGPTGMVYNPGTALGEEWQNHFFIAEFRGSPANSPIHAFTLRPEGASFALDHTKEVVKGLLPTGLDFGVDGALYFSDWIDGWGVKNQGRIWKLDVLDANSIDLRMLTKTHLEGDFTTKSADELGQLLAFPDMRVRQKAQFALAKMNEIGLEVFMNFAGPNQEQMSRIHAIWGIGQLARRHTELGKHLVPLLSDADPEIQAQAAKIIGDVSFRKAEDQLIELLTHTSLRVQFFAAEALGRIQAKRAIQPLIAMLLANDDQDAWLRHAGTLGLARIGNAQAVVDLHDHPSRAVRIAAVVTLRRMQDEGIQAFLADTAEYVVTEAARAINDDYSIEGALPALARLLGSTQFTNEALIRRCINANLRLGEEKNLSLLIGYMLNSSAPKSMRAEALAALSTWPKPSVLDRVDGRYRGEIIRNSDVVVDTLRNLMPDLLQNKSTKISITAMEAGARLKMLSTASLILTKMEDDPSNDVVLAGIHALHRMNSPKLSNALKTALRSGDSEIRSEALALLPASNIPDDDAEALFSEVLSSGSIREKQAALQGVWQLHSPVSARLISQQFEQFVQGNLSHELQLDVLEAAKNSDDPQLVAMLSEYEKSYKGDIAAEFSIALAGGDAAKGQRIFSRREAAQCVRCHSIWEWGGDAGPNLSGVATRLAPEKLLESLILPSAELAPGYEVVSLTLADDSIVAGIVKEETESTIILNIGREEIRTISKSDVVIRQNMPSAMPSMQNILSKREIRDVVAFLQTLDNDVPHQ
ncbi:MAG: heme-binding protein [Saprospiraceae bacterium]|nr:heme-binding protein [Saprospiraceae bacterium]